MKKHEAYRKLYPEDETVDLIKLEQVELDPETQLQVDEWVFNQRLQEKYTRFFARQKAPRPGSENSVEHGKAMSDATVHAIQLYLNEKHERDYMVSRNYEEDSLFEKEHGSQQFDIDKYE